MKHLYSILAAGTLMAASAMTAEARYWTYDFTSPAEETNIQADTWYCLQGGYAALEGSSSFLYGEIHSTSANLTTENLYKFIATGETTPDGSTVYYVQRYDGTYLYAPGQVNFYGNAVDRAWKVTVKAPIVYESDFEYSDDDNDYTGMEAYRHEAMENEEPLDLSTATYCDVDNGLVIASAEGVDPDSPWTTYVYLCGLSSGTTGSASKATSYASNCWVLYPAEIQSAYESLIAIMNEMTDMDPASLDLSAYSLGTGAGEYSQELYDAFMTMWNRAMEIYESEGAGATDEEMDDLASKLLPALEAFQNSGVGLSEGYYILYSMRPHNPDWVGSSYPFGRNGSGYDDGAIYDGSVISMSDKNLRWSCQAGDVADFYLDTLDKGAYETAKYVWHAFKSGNQDKFGNDLYYFQNIETDRYIGKDPATYSPVVMHDTPQVDFTIAANPNFPGWFSFYSPELTVASEDSRYPADYSGLHCETSKTDVVAWDWRVGGSCWKVVTLTEDEVQALKSNLDAPKRLNEMKELVATAQDAINNSYSYSAYNADGTKSEYANSGSMELDGLVTSADQMASEATESSEGSLEDLFDGNASTFWHSWWSSSYDGDHYLQFTIDEEESSLLLKWVKRNCSSPDNGAPLNFDIYATDDEANLDIVNVPDEEGNDNLNGWETVWTKVASSTFKYKYTAEKTNDTGVAGVNFDKPYKYFRLVGTSRVSNSNAYMYAGEFRVYRSVLDLENSLINAIPEDIVAALREAIALAEEEIEDGAASQETLDKLKAAYEAFRQHYPDPTRVTDLVNEAKALAESAEEGDGLGYYSEGAIDALNKAIAQAESDTKEVMTVEEINSALAALNAALDAFNAALHVPATGLYVIKSKSSNLSLEGASICAVSSSEYDNVAIRGRVATDNKDSEGNVIYEDEANAALRPGIYWQVEKVEGGYTYKNLYTGKYLHPYSKPADEVVTLGTEPYVFGIQFAKEPGCFNLLLDAADAANGTYIYVNARPGSNVICQWNSATGRDNSAFEFVPQEAATVNAAMNDGGLLFDVDYPKAAQAYTFTVDMDTYVDGDAGAFYTVIGQDADFNIQLALATGTLEAGQAYIYIPVKDDTAALFFMPEGANFSTLAPTFVAKEHNGLCGILDTVELPEGSGIFNDNHSKVLTSEAGEYVAANTGYFAAMPETTATGDATLRANGKITASSIDGINTVSVINNRVENGIYSISGIRLNGVKNLPAGLYIINGKKYIVK